MHKRPKKWAPTRDRILLVVAAAAIWTMAAGSIAIAQSGFTDVPANHLFAKEIKWMADNGITRGCNPPSNTRFCPDDFVTRGQMSAFMSRLANSGAMSGTAGPAGADGADGADGAAGADGATGPAGADGATGATGADGAPGADGADGAPGADGADGAPGPAGAAGAAGADGATGATGPAGPQGPAGGVELQLVTIATATETATAICPAGHLVVGGGAERTVTNNFLVSSFPSGDGTAWTAEWSGTQGDGTVYAICALTPVVED